MNKVEIILPQPHAAQQRVLDSKARIKVICAGRRGGKTMVAIIMCINVMLAGKRCIFITPEFGLASRFFDDLLAYIPTPIITATNRTNLSVKLVTGGEIQFFSGEAARSVRGRECEFLVIDEAAHIPHLKDDFHAVFMPLVAISRGDVLVSSTPRGKGMFHALYQKGINGDEGFESFHFPSDANPLFPKDEFEFHRRTLPAAQFREEYLAEPSENQLNPFGTDNIDACTITALSAEQTVCYGVDIAGFGGDFTVITGLSKSGQQTYFDRFQLGWQTAQQRIANLPKDKLVVMDSTGSGQPIFEQLKQGIPNLIGYHFTNQSKQILMRELIVAVEKREIRFNEITAAEMHTFEQSRTSTGEIKFSHRPGYHDDTIMALALAWKYRNSAVRSANWKLY